jgi:hypothetical protein
MAVELARGSGAFQADDEGSIPFTRSNHFNDLHHLADFIPTRRLLLIPTDCPLSFRDFAALALGANVFFFTFLPIGVMVAHSREVLRIENKPDRIALLENVLVPDATEYNFAFLVSEHDVSSFGWVPDQRHILSTR